MELWAGKKPPFVERGVIRNTNFSPSGEIDYSNIAYFDVEEKQASQSAGLNPVTSSWSVRAAVQSSLSDALSTLTANRVFSVFPTSRRQSA